jgi:hypothetical protein
VNIFGIPYRQLVIDSPLSPKKVSKCLESIVWQHSPSFWLGFPPKDKVFVGFSSSHSFRLQKIYGFPKNIFKPTFYGTIEPYQSGSTIKVIITLDPVEWIVMVGYNLLLIYGAIAERNIYLIGLAVAVNLFEYLIGFAPEARFFEGRFLQEFESVNLVNQ